MLANSIVRAYPGASFLWVVSSAEYSANAHELWIERHGSTFVDDWERRCLIYDETERATSIKASVILSLLDANERVIFLDPDMVVHGALLPVEAMLNESSIVLTPHWISAAESNGRLTPAKLSRVGITNLGFLAAAPREEAKCALRWLDARTIDECVRGQEYGVFVDQRWSDFLPHLFGEVSILRDERINVGWWNGHARNWDISLLTHFSGFDPHAPDRPTQHLRSLSFSDLHPTARTAFQRYGSDLLESQVSPEAVQVSFAQQLVTRAASKVQMPLHPFDTPLGRLLCRTMVQSELTCEAIGREVELWLRSPEAERVLESEAMVEAARSFWARAILDVECTSPCSHSSILAMISGVDRVSLLALRERCVCGREKPLSFDRENV